MENKVENMDKLAFESHYSFEQYQSFNEAYARYRAGKEEEPDYKKKVDAWLSSLEVFDAGVMGKIGAMARAGLLVPCPHAEGRRIRWAEAWNRMVAGESPQYEWLRKEQEDLANGMGFHMLRRAESEQALRACYQELLARVDKGDLALRVEGQECDITGARLYAGLDNWVPYLFERVSSPEGKRIEKRVVEDAPKPVPQNVEALAPSGRLLVADWFRIDAFTDAVDPKETRWSGPSINTLHGRWHQTKRYASEHGFLSVSVGNSMPDILLHDGVLAIACVDGEVGKAESSKLVLSSKGRVCTDLWQATVIDEQVLIDIVAKSMGSAEAEKAVNDYVMDKDNNVAVMEWPKGKPLRASFLDYGMEGFECGKVDQAGLDKLYCAASAEFLEWRPVGAVKMKLKI